MFWTRLHCKRGVQVWVFESGTKYSELMGNFALLFKGKKPICTLIQVIVNNQQSTCQKSFSFEAYQVPENWNLKTEQK